MSAGGGAAPGLAPLPGGGEDDAERLDAFMARAAAAYYAGSREPFGRGGDFTTSPEISQAFGECLGLWCAVTWEAMGRPDPVLLVELGPGRGTLMADALRAVEEVAAPFRAALRLHLVEASPRLREAQQARLGAAAAPTWHEGIGTLPPGPMLLIANEFFDALPIRQFVRRGDAWTERFVRAGAFLERPVAAADRPPLPDSAPEGAVAEVSEPSRALAASIGARLAAQGGAALALDYGPAESGFGDSLQAMRAHASADPLAEPGTVDVTAHVDFAALATAAREAGAAVHGPLPQGVFLQRLGLMTRASVLARGAAGPRAAQDILSGAQRLVAPEGMGRLFKALALCHPGLPAPPGFEQDGPAPP